MRRTLLPGAAALALLISTSPAMAADDGDLRAMVRQLAERVARLEAENRALSTALDNERITEGEPAVAARLKTVEQRAAAAAPATALAETLEGISAELSVGTVAQRMSGEGRVDGRNETVLGWRGDLGV
ncbi:MAG: hypothetical protein KDH16_07695, partial [Rhodocyclaceae bacterium]|nr:hypothetical protein [Rhodocyclaceae bacterium]